MISLNYAFILPLIKASVITRRCFLRFHEYEIWFNAVGFSELLWLETALDYAFHSIVCFVDQCLYLVLLASVIWAPWHDQITAMPWNGNSWAGQEVDWWWSILGRRCAKEKKAIDDYRCSVLLLSYTLQYYCVACWWILKTENSWAVHN